MFENPRRGRQARNFATNAPKILDLKSSSEQIFSRKLPLGAPVHWTICVWLKPFVNVCVTQIIGATEQPTVRYHASTILSYMVSISVNKLYISLVDLVGCVTLSKKFSYRCGLTEQTNQVKSTATNVMAFTACISTLQVVGTFAMISTFWQPKKLEITRNFSVVICRQTR